MGVRAEAVPGGGADEGAGVQGEAERGEGREFGGGVLPVQALLGGAAESAQQGAGAAGGVEDGAGGAGQLGHQVGEAGRGERVLARVGVQVPAEQELERLPRAQFGREVDGAAQQRGGGAQGGGFGDAHGGGAQRAEAGAEHLFEVGGQEAGEPLVGAGGDLQPDGGPGVEEEQDAAGVQQAGDRALRMSRELLPDPLAQRTSASLPCLRSHSSTSVSAKAGLVPVPPTGLGKSAWRRRQLLTAARPTPASRAIPAAVTSVALSCTRSHSPRPEGRPWRPMIPTHRPMRHSRTCTQCLT